MSPGVPVIVPVTSPPSGGDLRSVDVLRPSCYSSSGLQVTHFSSLHFERSGKVMSTGFPRSVSDLVSSDPPSRTDPYLPRIPPPPYTLSYRLYGRKGPPSVWIETESKSRLGPRPVRVHVSEVVKVQGSLKTQGEYQEQVSTQGGHFFFFFCLYTTPTSLSPTSLFRLKSLAFECNPVPKGDFLGTWSRFRRFSLFKRARVPPSPRLFHVP